MTFKCAFCDSTDYGGEFAFMGVGVVEQHIRVQLCKSHWDKFYDEALRKGGWIPPYYDNVDLVTVLDEDQWFEIQQRLTSAEIEDIEGEEE